MVKGPHHYPYFQGMAILGEKKGEKLLMPKVIQ